MVACLASLHFYSQDLKNNHKNLISFLILKVTNAYCSKTRKKTEKQNKNNKKNPHNVTTQIMLH